MSAHDLIATPGQTVGPFFHYALPYAGDSELVPPGRADAVRLHGQVLDGDGAPVPDALIELWQADAEGRVCREPGSLRRDGFTFTAGGAPPPTTRATTRSPPCARVRSSPARRPSSP
jgi:protocatechuate 3,4-dioxygenase alpha subunit